MPSLWQRISEQLARGKSSTWKNRMSVVYAMGVWTMLGFVYVKWTSDVESIIAPHYGVSPEFYKKLSEEERTRMKNDKKAAILLRQQELAEYVAENIYTPVDFMG